ncbi:MAG: 5-formyltetrahydrofolate cyclo-ligase [Paracoccus sp. (in: a-proteobacteria)]|nr:5-formyltetrahydrofolate cyclo-ligase [Paracoccus sp. (in: a-proteobacteria)]
MTATKDQLRAVALAARRAGGDAAALTSHLRSALAPHSGKVLAGYWPMRDEADPRPAMLFHRGTLCLPVVQAKAMPLLFRVWTGEELEPGPWGTMQPSDMAPAIRPEVLIVPLAGFDSAGNRIGYGGGYYDRSLQMLRQGGPIWAVGLAFACQRLEHIPAEPFDEPLDLIVTEKGAVLPRR